MFNYLSNPIALFFTASMMYLAWFYSGTFVMAYLGEVHGVNVEKDIQGLPWLIFGPMTKPARKYHDYLRTRGSNNPVYDSFLNVVFLRGIVSLLVIYFLMLSVALLPLFLSALIVMSIARRIINIRKSYVKSLVWAMVRADIENEFDNQVLNLNKVHKAAVKADKKKIQQLTNEVRDLKNSAANLAKYTDLGLNLSNAMRIISLQRAGTYNANQHGTADKRYMTMAKAMMNNGNNRNINNNHQLPENVGEH